MEELHVEPRSVKKLTFKTLKRTLGLFSPADLKYSQVLIPPHDPDSKRIRISHKLNTEYYGGMTMMNKSMLPSQLPLATDPDHSKTVDHDQTAMIIVNSTSTGPWNAGLALPARIGNHPDRAGSQDLVAVQNSLQARPKAPVQLDSSLPGKSTAAVVIPVRKRINPESTTSGALISDRITSSRWRPRPAWHAPWKNYRVISGHSGWVRSIAFDPSNLWFGTGSADRTIKLWDVGTGTLKLTLTGHTGQVRGLAVSSKHTYMFSAGDDKLVKCWDLEQNKVIRSYHGHLLGVYCLALHPTLDILLTGRRDSVCRVWDIRTKLQIHALSGHDHKSTVFSVFARPTDPQVVTGSSDATIKLWDLRTAKTMSTLTHHKKSIRAMALHTSDHQNFASASADNIKKFSLPRGKFVQNMFSQQKATINAMAVNEEGVMATGGDTGSLWFWDWKSGYSFQQSQTIVQPGSLDCEAGIYALSYDVTGTRLVSCEADKTIKMWKEDENATPETHPLNFKVQTT